jgi:hypothetical protein
VFVLFLVVSFLGGKQWRPSKVAGVTEACKTYRPFRLYARAAGLASAAEVKFVCDARAAGLVSAAECANALHARSFSLSSIYH